MVLYACGMASQVEGLSSGMVTRKRYLTFISQGNLSLQKIVSVILQT